MKGIFCTGVVITALLTFGCEGLRLMTTNIDVECTQESTTATSEPAQPPSETEIQNREELPVIPRKTPDKKMSSAGNVFYQNKHESSFQARFILPVDHFVEPSCPTNTRAIDAIPQLTGVWCWAASAEAVMKFHDVNNSLNTNQCNIVNTVFNGGTPSDRNANAFCCINDNKWLGSCQNNGLPEWAFDRFAFSYRTWNVARKGPLTPEEIMGQICQNGPFILVLHFTRDGQLVGGGHSLVVSDYFEFENGFHVLVHDHDYTIGMNNERITIDFQLWSYDDYVNARWGRETNRHSWDYVQIRPQQ